MIPREQLGPQHTGPGSGLGRTLSIPEVFVVDTVTDRVGFLSDGKEVSVESLGPEVSDGVDHDESGADDGEEELSVSEEDTLSSLHVGDEVGHIIGHLGSGGSGVIVVVNHIVLELSGHTDDHVIEVGVEVLSFGDIDSGRRRVLVSGEDVVDVGDSTRSKSDL